MARTYKRFRVKLGIGARRGGDIVTRVKQGEARKHFRAIEAEINRWMTHVEIEMGPVLVDGLRVIFDVSQELVPKATGELARSGYVTSARSRALTNAEIGYAKHGLPDYAVVVHEDLTKFHEDPTQAKFLEDPLNDMWPDFEMFVRDATKDMAGF